MGCKKPSPPWVIFHPCPPNGGLPPSSLELSRSSKSLLELSAHSPMASSTPPWWPLLLGHPLPKLHLGSSRGFPKGPGRFLRSGGTSPGPWQLMAVSPGREQGCHALASYFLSPLPHPHFSWLPGRPTCRSGSLEPPTPAPATSRPRWVAGDRKSVV